MKINYSDPLNEVFISDLVKSKDEGLISDYKAEFIDDNKHWLDISKDCVSFANNMGGYLLFGVRNNFELCGVDKEKLPLLTNTNVIQQKITKFAGYEIDVKTRSLKIDSVIVVCWFILPADELIVFNSDGYYKHISGKPNYVFRKGQIWVRKNSGNKIMNTKQLTSYILKREQQAVKDLLKSFTAVAQNPKEYTLSKLSNTTPVRITSDPKSTPVHGASFTIQPETLVEKINAYVAVYNANSNNRIDPEELCEARINRIAREDINEVLAVNCLLSCVPILYWFAKLNKVQRKKCIMKAINSKPDLSSQFFIARISNICGASFYKEAISKIKKVIGREITEKYIKNIRDKWTYTTNTTEIPKKTSELNEENLKTLKELTRKYKDPIYSKKRLFLEYTLYFMEVEKKSKR